MMNCPKKVYFYKLNCLRYYRWEIWFDMRSNNTCLIEFKWFLID